MSSNEFQDQPTQLIEDEHTEEPLNHVVPDTKSGVGNAGERTVMAKAKYSKGDMVHMATIANGQRVKGVFTIQAAIYNPKGWVEYQLKDSLTDQLHRHGAGVRERDLKPGA
ncbi:uncharacterized protein EKO05_0009708 [Ascochyta rabiei]|uniref:uncharacterized protein n=1 Tax=Didymella rabiei TaxID=5454 RepID=UPI0018FFC2EE|nr:uncharacterized protein EKO05_0009708 [Ascochyta rabiei]UPX19447.1 hypothetical protein EKO05_0009708 [Ascochyta rabiei]